MKHIKKIKPASTDSSLIAKGDKSSDPRVIKDLRPCIPVDGN